MNETERALMFILISNFPIVIGLVVAGYKGWITIGAPHRQLVDLLTMLLTEQMQDNKAQEARIGKFADNLGELANVVSQSLDLNERLLNERAGTRLVEWDGAERRGGRGRRTPRVKPRSNQDS